MIVIQHILHQLSHSDAVSENLAHLFESPCEEYDGSIVAPGSISGLLQRSLQIVLFFFSLNIRQCIPEIR